jgi:hypothetical protein
MSFRAWSMFSLLSFSLESFLQHMRPPLRIMPDLKESSMSLKTFIVEPVAAQARTGPLRYTDIFGCSSR